MKRIVSTTIAIGLIVAAFFLGKSCGGGSATFTSDTTRTSDTSVEKKQGSFVLRPIGAADTVYDSFENVEYKYRDTGSTDTIQRTDTQYVMLDYFRYRKYNRAFTDSNIAINVELGVAKNKLQDFKVDYSFDETTITNTTTIENTRTYNVKLWGTSRIKFNRINLGVELDFGKNKIGLERTMLSETKLSEAEKWSLEYGRTLGQW